MASWRFLRRKMDESTTFRINDNIHWSFFFLRALFFDIFLFLLFACMFVVSVWWCFFFVCLFLLLFALMYILINSLLCGFHHVQTFAFFLLVFLHIVVSAAFACRPLFFLQLTFITPFLFIFLFVGEWECCYYSLICVSNLLFSFFIFLLADFDCDSFFQSNYISIMFFSCVWLMLCELFTFSFRI